MNDFIYKNPTKLIFGKTSMGSLAKEVAVIGKKVLLTYGGGSIKKNGIYEKVMRELNDFEVREFGGIEPNPRMETLNKGVALAKEFDPDLILAVGGGSVIDGSKYISAVTHYDGDPWEMLTNGKEPTKFIPIGDILTLSATGTEMDCFFVVTKWETHEKPAFTYPQVFPIFSILDPQNTYSVSREQTAYGVVDAYSHVLEQYINTIKDVPLQDRFSESILLTLIENSGIALNEPTNYQARANLMLSATMALNGIIAMGVSEDWATHGIEHEFSAFYDIPHGAGLAVITPRWMEVIKDQKADKLEQYGKRVWGLTGERNEVINNAINKTYEFFKSLGLKMNFSEWRIDDKYYDEMMKRLTKATLGEIPLKPDQIKEILTKCLVG